MIWIVKQYDLWKGISNIRNATLKSKHRIKEWTWWRNEMTMRKTARNGNGTNKELFKNHGRNTVWCTNLLTHSVNKKYPHKKSFHIFRPGIITPQQKSEINSTLEKSQTRNNSFCFSSRFTYSSTSVNRSLGYDDASEKHYNATAWAIGTVF